MRYFSLTILIFLGLAAQASSKKISLIIPSSQIHRDKKSQNLINYAKNLGKDLKKNWFPKDHYSNYRSVVKIDFLKGLPPETNVSESSGDQDFDNSVLLAVNRSLYQNTLNEDLSVEYVFDYKNSNRSIDFGRYLSWPAKIGSGYASKKLGVNHLVFINL